eukprot:5419542-Pleurochrysis_carterae.AAC.1
MKLLTFTPRNSAQPRSSRLLTHRCAATAVLAYTSAHRAQSGALTVPLTRGTDTQPHVTCTRTH